MKINKKPIIIMAVITVLFVLATVLCIVVPRMTPKEYKGPVQVSEKICTKYDSAYGEYMLQGKIKNVSDETVTLPNNGGIIIYYNGDMKISSGWIDNKDIVLAPNEEFNFKNSEYGS